MFLSTRDRIATVVVAIAVLVYVLWLVGIVGALSVEWVAVLVLALGFVASASAVVPGFAALIRGSRSYLVAASLLGLIALGTGIATIVNATEETLAVLVLVTIVLWAAATVRHTSTDSRAVPRTPGSIRAA